MKTPLSSTNLVKGCSPRERELLPASRPSKRCLGGREEWDVITHISGYNSSCAHPSELLSEQAGLSIHTPDWTDRVRDRDIEAAPCLPKASFPSSSVLVPLPSVCVCTRWVRSRSVARSVSIFLLSHTPRSSLPPWTSIPLTRMIRSAFVRLKVPDAI